MSSRLRIRKKSTRIETPDVSTTPAQGMFQSRPFVVETHSAEKSQQQPDLKIALMRAQRYGHHLHKMQPAGLEAPTSVQQNGSPVQRKPQEQAKLIQPLKEAVLQRAPGTETTATEQEVKEGEVYFSDKKNQLAVKDGTEELVFKNSDDFKIAAGTKIKYKKYNVNQFLAKAEIIEAGERPAARDLGGEIKKTNQQRTEEVRNSRLITLDKIALIGVRRISGARKHYNDAEAVARSDQDVMNLISSNLNNVEITAVEPTKDTFKIALGGNDSIVGDIEYTDNQKKTVSRIKVFHVGPSLA